MLAILAERYRLGDDDPSLRVLFGGSSAGAFGAHFNVERVRTMLPKTAAAERLMLFVDAGWMIDWDDPMYRIEGATVRDREVWRRARDFWGATFDPVCEAAVADPMDCWFGPGWYPHVSARVPTLVQQCTVDGSFALSLHGLMPMTPALARWRNELTASLSSVSWLFSGNMPYHTLALNDGSFVVGPAGSTIRDVVARFFTGGAPERIVF
jgi:hypothetical protein